MEHCCLYCGNIVEASHISNPDSKEFIGYLYVCFQCDKEVIEYNDGKVISLTRNGRIWDEDSPQKDEEGQES